ncbi:MAG: PCYCGC domain-containing protein [Geobacteraceae bacterium]|nr:PCYCGC domain-containing protein [Geobacteraceae bacterium]
MKLSGHLSFFLIALLVVLSIPALAMDKKQEKEFHRISGLSLDELTEHANAALAKRYPDEKWETHRFPDYVFRSESIEAAYKIAVKRPDLLAKIHCYCPCEAIGHKTLLHCFFKNGEQGVFDKHAVFCVICYGEALLAFLWAELGATDQEIIDGMKKKYLPERTIPEEIMLP